MNPPSDPLTSELMIDPVGLPLCGQVVDRTSITTRLATSLRVPSTREPLTERDLLEEAELRAEICSWLKARCATATPAPHLA